MIDKLPMSWEEQAKRSDVLLVDIKASLTSIEALLERFNMLEEDKIYRFYHQSFKVFALQTPVREAVALFELLRPPQTELNGWFRLIVDDALRQEFSTSRSNDNWLPETRPIVEAFWHCKYMLEQMARYGKELDKSPQMLPSGWASVLYLFNLR